MMLSRRKFLIAAGAMAACSAMPARAERRTDLVVLTSYPDDVVSRYESLFEKLHPQYRLRIIWRMPFDAVPYLEKPGQGGVDVYWSASPPAYYRLKAEGAWRKLDVDRSGLPGRIGATLIDDPDGFFAATEVAGYGFLVNPGYLEKYRLPMPKDWGDLADPVYAGRLVMPDPAAIGFAPVMLDIPLQYFGWEKGWAMWSAIAANSRLVGAKGAFITDEIGMGKGGIGLTIDFFAASMIANGAPLRFVYPEHGGFNPGQVAITKSSANPEGAKAFVSMLLSGQGQKILADPDIRKLPVRPSVYASLPGYFDPFAAGNQSYDNDMGRPRLALLAAAFGQGFTSFGEKRAEIWRRIGLAKGSAKEEATALFCTPPASEKEGRDADLLHAFSSRSWDAKSEAIASDVERGWAEAASIRLSKLEGILGS